MTDRLKALSLARQAVKAEWRSQGKRINEVGAYALHQAVMAYLAEHSILHKNPSSDV
jgi:hypothetical protein